MPKRLQLQPRANMCSQSASRYWEFIRCMVVVAGLSQGEPSALAQTGELYGRTTASGLWSAGAEWIDLDGNTGSLPTSDDDVLIGSTGFPPSAVSPATVILDGVGVAREILIGDLSGGPGNGTLSLVTGGSLSASTLSLEGGLGGTARLNLNDQAMTLASFFAISGNGASVTRGSGGITANGFSVDANAVYVSGGSDNFSGIGSVAGGGAMVANVALRSLDGLSVSDAGSHFVANAEVGNATATFTVSSGASFTANADVFSYSFTSGDATLTLAAGILNAADIVLGNDSAAPTVVGRLGGTLATTSLTVSNSTSLTTVIGDSISQVANITTGATLALGQNLSLLGMLSVNGGTLALNGNTVIANSLEIRNGASVTRAGGGGIQAASFSISENSAFTAQAGDTLSGVGAVSNGASFVADVELNDISSLAVSGDGTSFTANQAITGAASVDAFGGGSIILNASLSGEELRAGRGSLAIASGTVSVSDLDLGVFFAGTTMVTRTGGIVFANNLLLGNGVAFTSLPGDQIGSVLASGSSSLTVAQTTGSTTGLWLTLNSPTALQLNDSATIQLNFGTPYAPDAVNWALKWTGDHVGLLESLRSNGRLLLTAPDDSLVSIAYSRIENVTFVSVVPEPSEAALTAIGVLSGLVASSWRRRRQ